MLRISPLEALVAAERRTPAEAAARRLGGWLRRGLCLGSMCVSRRRKDVARVGETRRGQALAAHLHGWRLSDVTPSESDCIVFCMRIQDGGGVSVLGGTVIFASHTLLNDNDAQTGANIQPLAGSVYYRLPTAAGYWLPNSECLANRQACDPNAEGVVDETCLATRAACSLLSGRPPLWQPQVPYDNTVFRCTAPTPVQFCDWQTIACSIDETLETDECLLGAKIYTIPHRPVEETFPYATPTPTLPMLNPPALTPSILTLLPRALFSPRVLDIRASRATWAPTRLLGRRARSARESAAPGRIARIRLLWSLWSALRASTARKGPSCPCRAPRVSSATPPGLPTDQTARRAPRAAGAAKAHVRRRCALLGGTPVRRASRSAQCALVARFRVPLARRRVKRARSADTAPRAACSRCRARREHLAPAPT